MVSTSRKNKEGKYNCTKSYKDAYLIYKKKFDFKSLTTGSSFGKTNPKNLMIDLKQYRSIWFDLADEVFKQIIEDAADTKLPYKLADSFRVKKRKMSIRFLNKERHLKMDYRYFLETGKKRVFLNEHTDHHSFKFFWFCKVGPKNKGMYKFLPLRKRQRQLAHQIIEHKKDYYL